MDGEVERSRALGLGIGVLRSSHAQEAGKAVALKKLNEKPLS